MYLPLEAQKGKKFAMHILCRRQLEDFKVPEKILRFKRTQTARKIYTKTNVKIIHI
jgi:hypothetical protein